MEALTCEFLVHAFAERLLDDLDFGLAFPVLLAITCFVEKGLPIHLHVVRFLPLFAVVFDGLQGLLRQLLLVVEGLAMGRVLGVDGLHGLLKEATVVVLVL